MDAPVSSTGEDKGNASAPSLDMLKALAAAWYADGHAEWEREALAQLIREWSSRRTSTQYQ